MSGDLKIYIDGASRGNPGESGAGIVIKDGKGRVFKRLRQYLGRATNNQAEYRALLLALKASRELGQNIRIYSDSELLVKQLKGSYRVKSKGLKPYFDEVRGLLRDFSSWEIAHIPREQNMEADALANEAIDTKEN